MTVTLSLPDSGELKIQKDQKIQIGDPFIIQNNTKDIEIDICKPLGLQSSDIYQCLHVVVGDSVTIGSVLASKKKLLGRKTVEASDTGVVKNISHESGSLMLSIHSGDSENVPAFFSGKIKSLDEDKKTVTIDISGAEEIKLENVSKDFGGKSVVLQNDSEYFSVTEDDIAGNVVVVEKLEPHVIAKVEALDGVGILYTDGQPDTQLPTAKISKESDIKNIKKHSHIVISKVDSKALMYSTS